MGGGGNFGGGGCSAGFGFRGMRLLACAVNMLVRSWARIPDLGSTNRAFSSAGLPELLCLLLRRGVQSPLLLKSITSLLTSVGSNRLVKDVGQDWRVLSRAVLSASDSSAASETLVWGCNV